jgi:SNF2 family DNA or RNA helicase
LKIRENKTKRTILEKGYNPEYSSISLNYGKIRNVKLRIGARNRKEMNLLARGFFDDNNFLLPDIAGNINIFIEKARELDNEFRCYDDAVDFLINMRDTAFRDNRLKELFPEGKESKSFDSLIKTSLYNYQKEGVLFAAKAGRALIADEMGLGKTIQAIASAEIMTSHFGVEKILIICPTSLKYQWKSEIQKFTDRTVKVIEGMADRRQKEYFSGELYKVASYHAVRNDISSINELSPDLVILDEAQKIKNWKTKTAQGIKNITSRYAIVLTGTPIENRIDELHSIVQFIDRYALGPLFRFLYNHQVTDNAGKVTGYKDLKKISKTLEPVMIRRSKKEIAEQLPERIDNNFFVPVTTKQMEIHSDYADHVARLVHKWRKLGFLPEEDKKRLLVFLSIMRMVSDSTYILDQETRHDTKIAELTEFLSEVFERKDQKVVIFSQWERMTRLVAGELDKMEIKYEYLHGGVPSSKRKSLLDNFNNNGSKVFLSTDAGGIGLNLQTASMVINLDIPWNPAVLEQRIGRVHRLGQKNHVQVVNFISTGTIEHRILYLLDFKKAVFEGVLDDGEDNVFMGESQFNRFMHAVESIIEEPVIAPMDTEPEHVPEPELVIDEPESPFEEVLADEPIKEAPASTQADTEKVQVQHQQTQDLFNSGIDFLQKLGSAISGLSAGNSQVSGFIEKDEKTGKTNLKIPMPDEEILGKAINAFSLLLQAFAKK